ncbi:MAG: carnitine dehydratase [Polaromonas sp.]|nr:carnitine dehydratase [Polaromonas sp.]
MENILNNIRVLELGQVLAAPFAGAIFADLGAEVVKLERVEGGDDARRMGPSFRNGDAHNFHVFNRGKKSITIDLKTAAGLQAFEKLVGETDILVHNLRPGVTEQMGIDSAALCKRHPRLIFCEISAFGNAGPMRLLPGYEPLIQAFSGLSSINGGPQDPPMRTGASICDQGSGMWAVIGALALLQRRHTTGKGGVVSTSLLETALVWTAQRSDAYVNEGILPARHRSGHPGFVPYEAFDTADSPILICCGNDRLFAKLAHDVGRDDWVADPRFSTNQQRIVYKTELFSHLVPIMRTQSRAQWLARLNAAGVPCAPIHTVPEAIAHPQIEALGILQAVPGENFKLTALPMSIDGVRPALKSGAPRLGEHNLQFHCP